MRMPNKNVTKVVAGIVAASTLTSSCTGFLYEDTSSETTLPDKGLSAINLNLSKEEIDYLIFLDKLGKDVIENPIIAQEFVKNPQLFVENYGYNEKVDLDENLLSLILALADEDINTAVKAGDAKLFLSLLNEKGLLNNESYSKINISEDQKNELLGLLGIDQSDYDKYSACTLAFVCLVAVVVGATTLAVALYYAAAGAAAAVGLLAYFKVEVAGVVNKPNISKFLDNNPALKVWGLKGDSKNTYVVTDMYLEEKVNDVIEGLEVVDKDVFVKKNISKEQFKELLKLNLLKYQ